MPKSKKRSQKTEPVEDTQKLYARAYASRLAKQVQRGKLSAHNNDAKKPTAKS